MEKPSKKKSPSRWFAAHVVMMTQLKEHKQDHFPVWENIVLIEAANEAEAFEKAEARGRADEGDDDGSYRYGRRPAKWVFGGVRKLTECIVASGRPESGDEITYLELYFKTKQEVKRFVAGKSQSVIIADKFLKIIP
jgi:hypothetical protein